MSDKLRSISESTLGVVLKHKRPRSVTDDVISGNPIRAVIIVIHLSRVDR